MKRYKPTSKSRRQMSTISFGDFITATEPVKSLTHGFRRQVGRNHHGKVTTRHKGGGHKRLYREIDFKYDKINIPYTIKTVEYDPNRSGFIGLAQYKDGAKRYILLPRGIKVGDTLMTGETAEVKVGNRLPLKNITVGTFVYNVEVKPLGGAKLARSAGNFVEVIAKDAGFVDIKLPSTEVRKVKDTAWASIGDVSNNENRLVNLGKAGRSRWLGIKPTGKGQKSRTPKKYSNKWIVSRRKVGKKK